MTGELTKTRPTVNLGIMLISMNLILNVMKTQWKVLIIFYIYIMKVIGEEKALIKGIHEEIVIIIQVKINMAFKWMA